MKPNDMTDEQISKLFHPLHDTGHQFAQAIIDARDSQWQTMLAAQPAPQQEQKHDYIIELPDGDVRETHVWWTERKATGDGICHKLSITVSETPSTVVSPEAQPAPQQETAEGDIRALKYRIHELEGEVIGYKRILDAAQPVAQQEPVITDEKGRPMTYWGGKAQPAPQQSVIFPQVPVTAQTVTHANGMELKKPIVIEAQPVAQPVNQEEARLNAWVNRLKAENADVLSKYLAANKQNQMLLVALTNCVDAIGNCQALINPHKLEGFAKTCKGANDIALELASAAIAQAEGKV